MSIPGKVLIACLSALVVSFIASTLLQGYALGPLLSVSLISAICAVVLSHRALPVPSKLQTADSAQGTAGPARAAQSPAPKKKHKKPRAETKAATKAETKKATGKASPELEAGTVKWFNGTKGFGFIIRENGEEIFVHHRSIQGEGRRSLTDGAAVRFRVVTTDKGPQAEDVETQD